MTQKTHNHNHLKTLRMPTLRENLDRLLMTAEAEKISYQTFLYQLLTIEVEAKSEKQRQSRIKQSRLNADYRVIFITMDELMQTLKTQEVIKRSEKLLKKIRSADLVIIDELGYLPVSKIEANLFFQLISDFYENRSIIVTSNKGLSKWAEVLGDPVITTAILDRLMHHSEIFNLSGKSYRLENRKKIFSES